MTIRGGGNPRDDRGAAPEGPSMAHRLSEAATRPRRTRPRGEAGPGPGGPNTQCTFQADRGDTSSDNGWVAYIPASQLSLEYHQPEAMAGVGVEAFRGSPQSGEILATGASPGFRLFVASGDDAAIKFAKALVSGS